MRRLLASLRNESAKPTAEAGVLASALRPSDFGAASAIAILLQLRRFIVSRETMACAQLVSVFDHFVAPMLTHGD